MEVLVYSQDGRLNILRPELEKILRRYCYIEGGKIEEKQRYFKKSTNFKPNQFKTNKIIEKRSPQQIEDQDIERKEHPINQEVEEKNTIQKIQDQIAEIRNALDANLMEIDNEKFDFASQATSCFPSVINFFIEEDKAQMMATEDTQRIQILDSKLNNDQFIVFQQLKNNYQITKQIQQKNFLITGGNKEDINLKEEIEIFIKETDLEDIDEKLREIYLKKVNLLKNLKFRKKDINKDPDRQKETIGQAIKRFENTKDGITKKINEVKEKDQEMCYNGSFLQNTQTYLENKERRKQQITNNIEFLQKQKDQQKEKQEDKQEVELDQCFQDLIKKFKEEEKEREKQEIKEKQG